MLSFSRASNNNITAGPQTVSPVYHESRGLLDNPRWRTPSEKSCFISPSERSRKKLDFPHPREKCLDVSFGIFHFLAVPQLFQQSCCKFCSSAKNCYSYRKRITAFSNKSLNYRFNYLFFCVV